MHKRTSFIIALVFAETPEEVFKFMFWTGHILNLSKEEERAWVHIIEGVVNDDIIGLDRVEVADRFLILNELEPLLK